MLIMTSIIRVRQSQSVTVTVSLDEGSHEHILNCIHILNEMEVTPCAQEIFSKDAKAAYSKMLGAQEVNALVSSITMIVVVSF